ncbi:hypothetical protein [Roseovarius indicus]|uniref:hypothetical protein n=1 Tax=Roseovarius indicus TaxID=540747 RepID=UPI0007DA053A|nr:hypothetical protein [Roseovarius indicus]OAO06403.1 hypothetical protein A8B76_08700 [Roseovarius indicus]
MPKALCTATVLALLPVPAIADDVFNDHVIVRSTMLCVGLSCVDGEPTVTGYQAAVKIKDFTATILFDDTSTNADLPFHDWRLNANERNLYGRNAFYITDVTSGTDPFWVEGGAPDDALFVADDGFVGLGTSTPLSDLHIVGDGAFPRIRLEHVDGVSHAWEVGASSTFWYIRDVTGDGTPVGVEAGTPSNTFVIRNTGWVGIGTSLPDAPLEVSSDDTYSYFRITAEQAAINRSADVTFTGGPLGTGELRYNIVDGDGPEMRLNANGDMVLDGTLTTGGPTCDGGCDAVFTKRRIIPEGEYAARMWADGHLPFVGPTRPEAPINVSEKMGGMLNALEHAHVFIERQNGRIATLEAEIAALRDAQAAQIASLTQRLAALAGTTNAE